MFEETLSLRAGEKVIQDFSISQRFVWWMIVFAVVLMILFPLVGSFFLSAASIPVTGGAVGILSALGIVSGGVLILYALYFRASRRYVFTTQRVIGTIGWISKKMISAEYEQITDLRVSQDIFERLLFGVGRVAINTAGADIEEIQLERVSSPYALTGKLRQLCELRLKETGGNAHGVTQVPPIRTGSAGVDSTTPGSSSSTGSK